MRVAYYLDPYLSQKMDLLVADCDASFVYSVKDHFKALENTSLFQRIIALARSIFLEIKAFFSQSFSNKVFQASQKIDEEIDRVNALLFADETSEGDSESSVDDDQEIPAHTVPINPPIGDLDRGDNPDLGQKNDEDLSDDPEKRLNTSASAGINLDDGAFSYETQGDFVSEKKNVPDEMRATEDQREKPIIQVINVEKDDNSEKLDEKVSIVIDPLGVWEEKQEIDLELTTLSQKSTLPPDPYGQDQEIQPIPQLNGFHKSSDDSQSLQQHPTKPPLVPHHTPETISTKEDTKLDSQPIPQLNGFHKSSDDSQSLQQHPTKLPLVPHHTPETISTKEDTKLDSQPIPQLNGSHKPSDGSQAIQHPAKLPPVPLANGHHELHSHSVDDQHRHTKKTHHHQNGYHQQALVRDTFLKDVKQSMGESFGNFFEKFLSKIDAAEFKSWENGNLKLKQRIRCWVPTNDPEALNNRILLLFGVHKDRVINSITIRFANETVSLQDKPKNMSQDQFQQFIGKYMKTMEFLDGCYTFIQENVTNFKTYQYPKITKICYIDDDHVFLKAEQEMPFFGSVKGDPRWKKLSDLEDEWITRSKILTHNITDKQGLENA